MWAKLPFTVVVLTSVSGCASSEDVGNNPNGPSAGGSVATGATSGLGATGGGGGTPATGGTSAGGASTGGASGSAGQPGSGGGPSGPPASVSGQVVQLLDWQTGVPDVLVCVHEDPSVECVTTDSGGLYTLKGVPGDAEVLIKYTKSGYFPALVTVQTVPGEMDVGKFPAPTNNEASAFASAVGVTIDFSKGNILTLALNSSTAAMTGEAGVSVSLSPISGLGPFYANDSYFPDKNLKWTSSAGAGLFANVEPGDAEVEMKPFVKTCNRYSTSWPGSTPTSAKVRVVAGYVTGGAILVCP
jgi:hypothetical protein